MKPYLAINCAISIDGKIAFADGSFVPFGSSRDRAVMCRLRREFDAVMCGATTIRETNATLDSTEPDEAKRCAVIVSGRASIDPNAALFTRGASVIIVASSDAPKDRLEAYRQKGAEVEIFPTPIRFRDVVATLSSKYHLNRILCEGGGTLNASLIEEHLVDVLYLTLCPLAIGGENAPTLIDGKGILSKESIVPLTLESIERYEDELFLCYSVTNRSGS